MAVNRALIKKIADEIEFNYREGLAQDFENNKGLLQKPLDMQTYSIKNIIAGYSIKILKSKEKLQWRD